MPVSIESWLEVFPMHLGFALITFVFFRVFSALLPWKVRKTGSVSTMWLTALSALGIALSTASWGIQFAPFAAKWVEFTRSASWWSFMILLASALLYAQVRIDNSAYHRAKQLQNATIQEQLLIQSVAQVKKNIELKDEVRQAKRNNLRSQMNPHFLFNVLTGIQHLLLNEQGDHASNVFRRFRKLLMQGFIHNDQIIGSIQQELNHVEQYIELESLRISKSIGWDSKVNSSVNLERTPCPKFLLQPLVENAIWHGLSGLSSEDPQIQIHVFWEDETLVLQVHDNGKGLGSSDVKNTSNKREGHQSRGTAIIRERLDLLRHPGRLELRKPSAQDPFTNGVVAEIQLPLWALEPPPKPSESTDRLRMANVD